MKLSLSDWLQSASQKIRFHATAYIYQKLLLITVFTAGSLPNLEVNCLLDTCIKYAACFALFFLS